MPLTNLELARSIYAAWERGDFSSAEWAHAEVEYVMADGPDPGSSVGLSAMAGSFRTWLRTWEEFHLVAEEYRAVADDRVLVLDHFSGRGKRSGLDLGRIQADGAWLFRIRDGKVTQMVRYWDRQRAFADLEPEEVDAAAQRSVDYRPPGS
ncbi:MAG TPA: nuclear transport factor 2 family protein [Thermoleophilaceae bacterium]|nr:nuclear transport factor 2 family protein [Thermoleophilaceae bacterium]